MPAPAAEAVAADVAIVGGGIAGASAAAALAPFCSVVLVERESRCGVHSTGRSAASFTENYGNDIVRRLAIASRSFLEAPPSGFSEAPLMTPRGMLTIARQDQLEMLAAELEQARAFVPSIRRIGVDEALARVPVLRADYVADAFLEPHSREIDVDALHQGYLRAARRAGAHILTGAEVTAVGRRDGAWQLGTAAGGVAAGILVNAAGAWADTLAVLAGAAPLGLVPERRTACHVAAPEGVSISAWPLVNDTGETFYFKPDAGRLFVSPSDATPSPPVDAQPEEIDVAMAIDRLERATTIKVASVPHRWAGLRTYAADRSPVVGFDAAIEGFFWLAGQGGYGIKTSPALSALTAALIRGVPLPETFAATGLSADQLSPARPSLRPAALLSSSQPGVQHDHRTA